MVGPGGNVSPGGNVIMEADIEMFKVVKLLFSSRWQSPHRNSQSPNQASRLLMGHMTVDVYSNYSNTYLSTHCRPHYSVKGCELVNVRWN